LNRVALDICAAPDADCTGTGGFHAKPACSLYRRQIERLPRQTRQAPEPAILPKCPEPPDWLHEYAKAEWWRTAPELHLLGLLSAIDGSCLAAYCASYAMWRRASKELESLTVETTGRRSTSQSADQNYPRRRVRHAAL
jgi:phage terminase small subunit